MGMADVASVINDQRSFRKKTSMINDERRRRRRTVSQVDEMADRAMTRLGIPETFRKSVLWLAWNRSEARFWELVEAAESGRVQSPGRYFIASIKQERRSRR